MKKRILIISGGNDNHIIRFLNNLDNVSGSNLIVDYYAHDIYTCNDINNAKANNVFITRESAVIQKLRSVRKIGVLISIISKYLTLKAILKEEQYDLVNIHQIPFYSFLFLHIAKSNGIKTMLTPWGSDVLRASKRKKKYIKKAFNSANYVSGDLKVGFSQQVKELFSIDEDKFIKLGYGSDVISEILKIKDTVSKEKIAESLYLPKNRYYITCGYNASPAQRHAVILEAIADNKDKLPKNYLIIVPLSYGAGKKKVEKELRRICEKEELEVVFITEYLTNEQVAYLRLITDLFIHIQTTDAYNASLQEMLLAGAQCINGKWLCYPTLEEYEIPYHVCEDVEMLPNLLKDILRKNINKISLHPDTISVIKEQAWERQIIKWNKFYEEI